MTEAGWESLENILLVTAGALVAGIFQWLTIGRSNRIEIAKEKRAEQKSTLKDIAEKLNDGAIAVQKACVNYKNSESEEGAKQEHKANKSFGDARMLAIMIGKNLLADKIYAIQNKAISAITVIKNNCENTDECNNILSEMNEPQTECYDLLRKAFEKFI